MELGIIGGGVVGKATARCFLEWANVKVYDVDKSRATHTLEEVLQSDLVFICLPTPQTQHKQCMDTTYLDRFFKDDTTPRHRNYVIRSTVPIGYTRRIAYMGYPSVVHNPEFLTARTSLTDILIPARHIIGGTFNQAALDLAKLYGRRFPGVPIFHVSSEVSEFAKLLTNVLFATKISILNEANTLAEKLDVNWQQLMDCVLSDGRITHSHTQVPGPDGRYGFGGACLPKDVACFYATLLANNLPASVTEAVLKRNEHDRERPV